MNENALTSTLVSQYTASLEMLRSAIEAAPPSLWDDAGYENRTWRIAYHTLYTTRLYLAPSSEGFPPWEGAIEGAESLGGFWEGPTEAVAVEGVHTPSELLGFLDALLVQLPEAVATLPLEAASGFEWYPITRLELHMMNFRHVQHHTGQLIERLRTHGVRGIDWVPGTDVSGW